jgi:benzoate membrane transport protein
MSSAALKGEQHWASLTASALASVVVGYASTILLIMQAADAVGASDAQKISWATGLSFVMGGLTLWLSWRHKMPLIIAWSTPGAALLATSGHSMSYELALGTFVVAGLLAVATGLIKPLAQAIAHLPAGIAAAMLAGVLVTYVLKVPAAAVTSPYLIVPLVLAFFAMRLWKPFYAVPIVVVLGLALAEASGLVPFDAQNFAFGRLTFDKPEFSVAALTGFAIPLYLVTMASQNLPGFAVLRASGYQPPVAACLVSTGLASVLLAPMLGPQINMAAITASLATGPDTHPDPAQRWKVAIPYFIFYAILGLAAAVFVKVLGALPHDLIIAIAGLGLFGPLMNGLVAMIKETKELDSALVTFLVTASGFTLAHTGAAVFGISLEPIGAAFWGLVAGLAVWGFKKLREAL